MSKKKKEAAPSVREFITARHDFTQDEVRQKTQELVQAMNQVEENEESAKAAAADFKAKSKAAKARMGELKNSLANGYELRQVECAVEFNRKKGIKTYRRHCPGKDGHGEVVERKEMTERDYELLPLQEKEPTEPAQAPAPDPGQLPNPVIRDGLDVGPLPVE